MKKRILSATLLLCFALSLAFSCGAYAAEMKHMHPRTSFQTPLTTVPSTMAEGSYYLNCDVAAESDIVIDKEVSLCLNGFTLDMGAYAIKITGQGSLTVYDCVDANGVILSKTAAEGAMIQNEASFVLDSGDLYASDRVILSNKGTATMAGGYVYGKNADLIHTIGGAMLTLNGGTVESNGSGSAVCMVADPSDETAKKKDYNVGIGGSCTVVGHQDSPGALRVEAPYGRFVINTGAVIKGYGCPAINVISGSFDAYGAAQVHSDSQSAIVGTGGKVSLFNAVIVSDEKYGVDISADAELLLSGALDILGGMASVHLAEGKLFSMSDYGFHGNVVLSIHTETDPTEGNPIAISRPCDKKHSSHFISSNPGCTVVYENGAIYNKYDGTVSHYHEGRNYILPLDRGSGDLTKNNFYLQEDMNRSGFFTGSMVNICLNGHTLSLSSAIKLYPGSTLNIFDCQGGGKIEANNAVIQDINNGSVKVVLHDGVLISHGSSVVKLTGDDTLVVENGQIISEYEGSSAVDVAGTGNRIDVRGGEISGVANAIKMQDAELVLSGEGSISGGVYAVDNNGYKQGSLTLEGAPVMSGGTADIHLAPNMLLSARNGFSPAEKISLAVDSLGDYINLSSSTDGSYGQFFSSTDGEREVVSGVDNALILTKPMNISPESGKLISGDELTFSVSYTGESVQPKYQWYLRDLSDMSTVAIDGAESSEHTISGKFPGGTYELFATVSDEMAQYVSRSASFIMEEDKISDISVAQISALSYTGTERTPIIEASASTIHGKAVSFSYSLDKVNYSAAIPSIGPEPGEYVIYYIASAEGCDDVSGELKAAIENQEIEQTEETKPEKDSKYNIDMRFIAIIGLIFMELIICTIYLILKVKNS